MPYPLWAGAPGTPGAFGNNPMAGPHGVAPQPKWLNALLGLVQGVGAAVSAPRNALMGNYDQLVVAPDGRVSQFDPRMLNDAANLAGLVTLGAGAAPVEADALGMGIRAYHGSPHSFDKFDMSKIGTGEGTQAYGHGLYFAGNEDVARTYRDALSDAPGKGSMYAVDINAEPSEMLDWDKPLSDQPKAVQTVIQQHLDAINADRAQSADALKKIFPNVYQSSDGAPLPMPATGGEAYDLLSSKLGNAGAATALKNAGLQGIQYLDAGSRGAGTGTRNYIVFDDNLINILKKYGIAAPIAGSAIGAASSKQSQPAPNLLTQPTQPQTNYLLGT